MDLFTPRVPLSVSHGEAGPCCLCGVIVPEGFQLDRLADREAVCMECGKEVCPEAAEILENFIRVGTERGTL